jgi:hypothetical protein
MKEAWVKTFEQCGYPEEVNYAKDNLNADWIPVIFQTG